MQLTGEPLQAKLLSHTPAEPRIPPLACRPTTHLFLTSKSWATRVILEARLADHNMPPKLRLAVESVHHSPLEPITNAPVRVGYRLHAGCMQGVLQQLYTTPGICLSLQKLHSTQSCVAGVYAMHRHRHSPSHEQVVARIQIHFRGNDQGLFRPAEVRSTL